jgi:CPA2 family monovalent cation:H+ antiporter-2
MADSGLLVNFALALIAATIGAAVAVRLGQSAILGYIVVGVLIGPYTPGPVSEPETVAALADIGLIFLLFAVGLQLSLAELLRVGRAAMIGGTAQVAAMLGIGYVVAVGLGFTPLEGLFLGAFIAMSSTTVLAKVMSERGEMATEHGIVALAWATVQDLMTIVLVVVLTGLSSGGELGSDLLLAVGKAVLFMLIVLPLGLRVLPWVLVRIAMLRSREVFVLTVVAVALGTAYASEFFGLSLALGAFVAGLLISESEISYQALGELAPLRDVFAGIFFVSVGMLVDPAFVISALPLVLLAVFLVVPVKGAIVAGLAFVFGLPRRTAVLAGVALAQSGEFSFLLARLGIELGVVSEQMFSLMLAAAAVSIVISPSLLRYAPHGLRSFERRFPSGRPEPAGEMGDEPGYRRHVVICGFGRVGRLIGAALERRGFHYVVVEDDPRICRALREQGIDVVQGSADSPGSLERAAVAQARVLVVALPDSIATRQVVHIARRANPRLQIVARARTAADREFLLAEGIGEAVTAETELGLEMARYTLGRLGVSAPETQAIVQGLRRRGRSNR